ncbi:MAG: hypothetical protein AUG84_02130 [Chloroflexi bacterium 13_1_20CM_4_66_7]|nr:MAG: hypothetical protein AUG84_02130 [Chloroflexi bacterium 13_1_20CM_4_66_7]
MMNSLTELGLLDGSLLRGVVSAIVDDGFLVRVRHGDTENLVSADLLCSSNSPVQLRVNDSVLCWIESDGRQGVILGRVGGDASPSAEVAHSGSREPIAPEPPDTLVLEAVRSLTLRVGDGSITIREDGKILIKGKDLVSHATRLNRIKGGAVQIN